MRLLLDEMLSHSIAGQLRERGHDASAVAERPELIGLLDPELFGLAQAERRALITDNIPDFAGLDAEYRSRGHSHWGLVFTRNSNFPRGSPSFTGLMVRALERLLNDVSCQEAPESRVHWLRRP